MERFRVAQAGEPERHVVITIDDPGIAAFAGEQCELTDGDDTPIVVGGTAGNIADFLGETKTCALDDALTEAAFGWAPPGFSGNRDPPYGD